jgi:hypothetical protein
MMQTWICLWRIWSAVLSLAIESITKNNEYWCSRQRQGGLSKSIPASYKYDDVNTRLQERREDEGK